MHATAGESTMDIELHEVHEFGALGELGVSPGAVDSAHATADENKGIVELHEVNESDLSKAEAAVAAATAGESEGNIRLFEVLESDFPSLPNSSHSLNSRLGSLSSACARCPLCCCCSCTCLPWFFISCCVCCCCTCACFDPARCSQFRWYWWPLACAETGTRRVKGGVLGPAEDLRPV